MFFLLALLLLAPSSSLLQGPVKLPDLGQLTRAVKSGDDVEIERVAARFGPVRLLRVAVGGRPEERLAALRGLAVLDDAWYVLPDLVRLLAEGDSEVADAAAVSVRQIAAGLSPETMFADEVPRDVPARAASALLEVARKSEPRPPLRVAALGALASLRAVTRFDENAYVRLTADRDPEVRRAAAEGLAGVAGGEVPLVRLLEEDVPQVAATAAAALCRDVPPTGNKGAGVDRATRLSPKARERLRQLALDDSLGLVDRLDLMGCLRVNAQPSDQKVLDQLARAKLDSLKRRARSLGAK